MDIRVLHNLLAAPRLTSYSAKKTVVTTVQGFVQVGFGNSIADAETNCQNGPEIYPATADGDNHLIPFAVADDATHIAWDDDNGQHSEAIPTGTVNYLIRLDNAGTGLNVIPVG